MSHEDLAKHLSFFVPPGFLLMKQEEIDRLHNESEARRIERDAAREALNRIAHADWDTPNWRRLVDIAREALGLNA